ncbi:unnamed protein product [Thelazia callipaeda]|uniref:Nucleoporin Nup43 n=1 Tax=Thelazia callipaeda TaxID=103827 RepID=A0A0N5D6S8_THECL|nr:unnamed protein product [Thelazia callipaeda]
MDIKESYYQSQFVEAKCSRVRWLDVGKRQKKFLTSSYDSPRNEIAAWSITEESELIDGSFACECRLNVDADVNDLLVYDATKFAAATNDGTLRLLEYDEGVIKPIRKYSGVHDGSACNALCYNDGKIISGSENGTIVCIDLEGSTSLPIPLNMASIRSLASVSKNICVSAHLDGQICVWDFREKLVSSSRPLYSCRVTDWFQGAISLAVHPAEPNLVGFGTEDGGIGFLDTHPGSYLLNVISVPFPVGTIWEIAFHPVYPSNLYCATGKGHLLHLSVKDDFTDSISNFKNEPRANAWLSSSVRSGNANVSTILDCLLSINSFSISVNGIIACSDDQMITYIDKKYLGQSSPS